MLTWHRGGNGTLQSSSHHQDGLVHKQLKEILLKISFNKETTITFGNKEVCQTLSTLPRENRFNPFDSEPLATLRFKMFVGIGKG